MENYVNNDENSKKISVFGRFFHMTISETSQKHQIMTKGNKNITICISGKSIHLLKYFITLNIVYFYIKLFLNNFIYYKFRLSFKLHCF